MTEPAKLTRETFLAMAELQGIDTSDSEHMDTLYESVKDIMATVGELRALKLDDVEPVNTFSPTLG